MSYWKISILARDINDINEMARKITYFLRPRAITETDSDAVFDEAMLDLENAGAKKFADIMRSKKQKLIDEIYSLAKGEK